MINARKLTLTGLILLGVLLPTAPTALAAEGFGLVASFGGPGSGPGQLSLTPSQGNEGFDSGVALNSEDDVYVADTKNDRVEWFSPTGKYEGEFNGREVDGAPARKEAPGRLSAPEGIAIDNDPSSPSFDDVYVADFAQGVVDKFTPTGEFVDQLHMGGALGGIAIDLAGDVWIVTETGQQFTEFSDAVDNTASTSVVGENTSEYAEGLAVDSEDNLYTLWAGILHKHDKAGAGLGEVCSGVCAIALAVESGSNDVLVDTGSSIAQYGPFGEPFGTPVHISKPNVLASGAGVAVDPTSHEVYVADAGSDQIDVFRLGAAPQEPETLTPSSVKDKSAVFRGKLTPAATKLNYYFEYNIGSSCTGGLKTPVKEGEGTVEEEVTGLQANAEYTYCIVAENTFAITSGSAVTPFTTLPAPPEVISESASSPSKETRELSAAINPENEETTYFFEYSESGSVSKDELTGEVLIVPGEPYPTLGAEFGERGVSVGGIAPNSFAGSLYYRVIAANQNGGTATGAVQAYTMLPLVEDESASGLTTTSVHLEASVNPEFVGETKYAFEYATQEAELGTPQATVAGKGALSEAEVNEPSSVSTQIITLAPGETYYYRAVAENEVSLKKNNANEGRRVGGPIKSFTTYAGPSAITGEASSVTATGAALSGTVNPDGAETSYSFQYISEESYRAALAGGATDLYAEGETTASRSAGSGASVVAAGPVLTSGLRPGETYHYRLVATNQFGLQSFGADATFATAAASPPLVSTGGASSVSQNSATLSGTVTANGLPTNYGFEVSTTPGSFGPATGLGTLPGRNEAREVFVALGELQSGTIYHYRLVATSREGTVYGLEQAFATSATPSLLNVPLTVPMVNFIAPPTEIKTMIRGPPHLTSAQKLAKALKACGKDKAKSKRLSCEKAARKKYKVPAKKHGAKK